ncbi:hypothetical protein C8R45DRAFT_363604 [Mycena sanguinolenta]|nr:hypothetical protein C8R45DRAFT_363604 [Mycena sanguinolenta]
MLITRRSAKPSVVGRPPHALLRRLHPHTFDWRRVPRLHTLLDIPFSKGRFWNRGDLSTTEQMIAVGVRATPFDQDFDLIINVAVGGTNGWFPDGQGNEP